MLRSWVAAAALVLATAGVTWQLATRAAGRGARVGDTLVSGPSAAGPEGVPPAAVAAAGATAIAVGGADAADASATLGAEIDALRALMDARRTELDPRTVATLEESLRVIDRAIAEARAALATDPSDRFLAERLQATMGRKLDVMRGAVTLPART